MKTEDSKKCDFFISVFAEEKTVQSLAPMIRENYQAHFFTDIIDGLKTLSKLPCNLFIIEVNSAKFDGFEIKKKLKKQMPSASLILVSRQKDLGTVVNAQKQGADYLFFLPLKDDGEFEFALKILHKRRGYWMELMRNVKA